MGLMNNWSFSRRLYALCGFLILCLCTVGALSYRGMSHLSTQLVDVSDVQLPAVRNMSLADMMHDGLRASVLRSIVMSESGDVAEQKLAIDEFHEMSANLRTYLANIDALQIRAETRTAIAQAKPEVEQYIAEGKKIVDLIQAGRRSEGIAALKDFQQSFESLEGKLEVLGELIEKDADQSRDMGTSEIRGSIIITLLFTLLGIILSLWCVRSLLALVGNSFAKLFTEKTEMLEVVDELKDVSHALSSTSQHQTSAIQKTASAAHEISSMAQVNADRTTNAMRSVEASKSSAEQGQAIVRNLIDANDKIAESNRKVLSQIESNSKQLAEMVRVINTIGDKTKVINDIVFQTKLLSFNASVEAARAGEHGKGFAVVAEEIGNLARMSGSAADEISQMLLESSEKADRIVKQTAVEAQVLFEEANASVRLGSEITERCGQSLDQIVHDISSVNDINSEIRQATSEQATGVEEINSAIKRLTDLNTSNEDASNSTRSATETLNERLDSLTRVIDDLGRLFDAKNVHSLPRRARHSGSRSRAS